MVRGYSTPADSFGLLRTVVTTKSSCSAAAAAEGTSLSRSRRHLEKARAQEPHVRRAWWTGSALKFYRSRGAMLCAMWQCCISYA